MAGYLMLGMFPPKIKNHQVLLDALLGHLQSRDLFSGITVHDCADPDNPVDRLVKLEIDRIVEDTKGLPNPTCCCVCPTHIGVCPICRVVGSKIHNRPCYVGAVTYLYERYYIYIYINCARYIFFLCCLEYYLCYLNHYCLRCVLANKMMMYKLLPISKKNSTSTKKY